MQHRTHLNKVHAVPSPNKLLHSCRIAEAKFHSISQHSLIRFIAENAPCFWKLSCRRPQHRIPSHLFLPRSVVPFLHVWNEKRSNSFSVGFWSLNNPRHFKTYRHVSEYRKISASDAFVSFLRDFYIIRRTREETWWRSGNGSMRHSAQLSLLVPNADECNKFVFLESLRSVAIRLISMRVFVRELSEFSFELNCKCSYSQVGVY